jgi:hypothetical protein
VLLQKQYHLFGIFIVVLFLVVANASASIFSIDDVQAVISLKTISSNGIISKDIVTEKDLKTDTIQTVQIQLSKLAKSTEIKTIQLYPYGVVLVSSDFAGTTNIMQTSTKEGYPLLEVYYGYQRDILESWDYYFRIEKVDKDNAYVIYADFSKKSVWLGAIPRSTYDTILSSGKIPEWESIK